MNRNDKYIESDVSDIWIVIPIINVFIRQQEGVFLFHKVPQNKSVSRMYSNIRKFSNFKQSQMSRSVL